jgi:imidazole glycerol-phosphate synthase subunit HisF
MDVKKTGREGKYEVWARNASSASGLDPVEFAKKIEGLGAGEVVINSIDRDGVMKGYDFELIKKSRDAITLPITVLGGAGTLKDMETLIRTFGIIGAAAGSLFVFKGKYRVVLINYFAGNGYEVVTASDGENAWALIISIPIWLILGIVLGFVWK